MTFDYLNPSRLAAIEAQFVRPSGLRVRGNARFADNGKRYLLHPAHHPLAADTDWRELRSRPGSSTRPRRAR